MPDWLNELVQWWAGLGPDWMFLLALPFGVALVGLAAHERRPDRRG